MADIPQLAFPLRLDAGGDLAVVEQDSLDDVRQCVFVLCRTPLGARPLAAQVGVEDPTFLVGELDVEQLAAQLETFEPRAQITVTADPIDPSGQLQVRIDVGLADDPDEQAIS